MAILIEKDLNIMGSIPVSQLYLRLSYIADFSGKYLISNVNVYVDKNAFLQNEWGNILSVDGVKTHYELNYDSSINGDPLLYIHGKIKEDLSTDILGYEQVIDPSTGLPVIDPSTGNPVYEEVVVTPKFAMDSSISFVDLD